MVEEGGGGREAKENSKKIHLPGGVYWKASPWSGTKCTSCQVVAVPLGIERVGREAGRLLMVNTCTGAGNRSVGKGAYGGRKRAARARVTGPGGRACQDPDPDPGRW